MSPSVCRETDMKMVWFFKDRIFQLNKFPSIFRQPQTSMWATDFFFFLLRLALTGATVSSSGWSRTLLIILYIDVYLNHIAYQM